MIDSALHTLRSLLQGNTLLFHAVVGLLICLVVIAAGNVVKIFIRTVGKKIIAMTDTKIDDEILQIIGSKIIALSSVIGIYLGVRELRKGLSKQHETFLAFLGYVDTALYIVSVVVVSSVVIQIARAITIHSIRSIAEHNKHEEFNNTLTPLLNRVVTFMIVAFASIVVFEHFGYSVTSLLTILGAGSLALGLAAQDTLSNMISGFIIMLDRPFQVGDRVKIPSGETGDVYEIGLRSTKILDFDNNVLIVPNNELIKTRILNYGYPHNEVRVVVDVGVSYGTDVALVKKILTGIAKANAMVLPEPAPEAFLMSFGESALQFRLACRVLSFQDQFIVAEKLRVQIYQEFLRTGIEIPLPQRVVQHTGEKKNGILASSKRKKIQR